MHPLRRRSNSEAAELQLQYITFHPHRKYCTKLNLPTLFVWFSLLLILTAAACCVGDTSIIHSIFLVILPQAFPLRISKVFCPMCKGVTEITDVLHRSTHLQVGVVLHPFCIVRCIADNSPVRGTCCILLTPWWIFLFWNWVVFRVVRTSGYFFDGDRVHYCTFLHFRRGMAKQMTRSWAQLPTTAFSDRIGSDSLKIQTKRNRLMGYIKNSPRTKMSRFFVRQTFPPNPWLLLFG